MAGLGVEVSWAATAFRVCAWRLCLAVIPVDGARPAGPDGSTPGDERAARGLRGLMGPLPVTRGRREACGVWLRCLWAAAGPGRASRSITPSEARVWRSRGRAAAHRRNRPDQVGRPRAARKCGGEDVARERGRQEFSVRRRRSRRGRLTNRSRMGRCGPSGSRGRSRRLRRLHRCRGPGRGRRRRRPGRV